MVLKTKIEPGEKASAAAPGREVEEEIGIRLVGELHRLGQLKQAGGKLVQAFALGCLVPAFDGALFSQEWKDALWTRSFTGAPARQRRSIERDDVFGGAARRLAAFRFDQTRQVMIVR